MKNFIVKFSRFAVIVTGILFFIACSEKEPILTVTPHQLFFSADDASEKSVTIETDATYWNYQVNSLNWLDVYTKANEKDKLFIRVHENSNMEGSRTGHVTVTAGKNVTSSFTVEQLKKETNKLSISDDFLAFNINETADRHVTITTDAPAWNAVQGVNSSWIKLIKQHQTLIVSLETNTQLIPRAGEIIVMAGNAVPLTISVTQGGTYLLMVAPTSLIFSSHETSSQAVTVTANTIPGWSATTNAPWLILNKDYNILTVTATPNLSLFVRYALICVTDGTQERVITVTQYPSGYLAITPTSLSFAANEVMSKSVIVTTNAPYWNAITNESWLHISQYNNILAVAPLTANTSATPRSALIFFTGGSAAPISMLVTQAGQ